MSLQDILYASIASHNIHNFLSFPTLQTFSSDGLGPLLFTMDAGMLEYSLKMVGPGHSRAHLLSFLVSTNNRINV